MSDGSTVTVTSSDGTDWWLVRNGSTLITNGANLLDVKVESGSTLIADGSSFVRGPLSSNSAQAAIQLSDATAVISNSRLDSDRIGLALVQSGTSNSNPVAVSATVTDSVINGFEVGVIVNAGTLALSSTDVSGQYVQGNTVFWNGSGIRLYESDVIVANGSVVRGDGAGIVVMGVGFRDVTSTVLVSGSHVEGRDGAAIDVAPLVGTGKTAISVVNGGTLTGGDGNILRVRSSPFGPSTVSFSASNTTLSGNILVDDSGDLTGVELGSRATLAGKMTNVSSVSLLDGGTWVLTDGSNVGSINLQAGGLVELGNGSAFNTLTVAGNYTGSGGTLLFNTVLTDDASLSDKLVIGGDTSGQTNVRVNNVGGAGAQTGQGIELISVAGASNGQFDLAGRAVGGQYEYFLFKGADNGNWYLRSQLPTTPDPCDTDPTLPECGGPTEPPVEPPVEVLRPEPGAYLANLTSAQNMFRVGYHDRHAGQNSGRAWARVDGSRNGFQADSRQLDVRGSSQALSIGADLLRNENGSAVGVMLSSGNASSTSTNALTGYYARGKVKGEALGIYGTWRSAHEDPYAGFYVDGSLQRAQFRNRVEGVALAAERYDSKAWQGAVESGYAFRVGGASNGGIYLEPQVQIGYSRWNNLRHTEANGTVVTSSDADGLFGRLGVRLSGVTRWGNGAAEVQPYLAAHWLHTRAASGVRIDGELVDAHIPRSLAEISGGASLKFASGVGVWGGLSLRKSSSYHETSAQMGLSYSW